MKLIITEEQYRLIVENEGRLFSVPVEFLEREGGFEKVYNLYVTSKEKKNFNGIKIIGDLLVGSKNPDGFYKLCKEIVEINGSFRKSNPWGLELPRLKRVEGNLILASSTMKELNELEYVGEVLNIDGSNIKSMSKLKYVGSTLAMESNEGIKELPELEYVGSGMRLIGSNITSLPKLNYVGGSMMLKYSSLSYKLTDMSEEDRVKFMKRINVRGDILI